MQGLVDRVCAQLDSDDYYWEKVPTPILDNVENPLCLKNLSIKVNCKLVIIFVLLLHYLLSQCWSISFPKYLSLQELKQLAVEIRSDLSSIMLRTQISAKASMAVVELTVAIHYVFNAPVDRILWDVGDQVRVLNYMQKESVPLVLNFPRSFWAWKLNANCKLLKSLFPRSSFWNRTMNIPIYKNSMNDLVWIM